MINDAIAKIPRKERQEPFRCRSRPKFQVDHSRHLEASACFRCTVLLFALRRGQEETGSVPVRLHNHDTGGRKCAEGREVPHWLCRLDGHIASRRAKSGEPCQQRQASESQRLSVHVGRNGRRPGVTSKVENALPKKPPSGGEADHDRHCRYAEKLLAAGCIFGRLVHAVMAEFDEHVAVHCNQRQENPVIVCEQCRIGPRRGIAE